MEQKIVKKFFPFQIIAFEMSLWSSSNIEEVTRNKSALMEVSQVFGTLSHVDCQSVFWNDAFYRVAWRSFS